MIFYGTSGAQHVRTEPAPALTCPACTSPAGLRLSVFSQYAHIYWVPLVPVAKPAAAECIHCQTAWALKDVPQQAPELREALRTLKKQTAAPWWNWSGLAVLFVALCWATMAAGKDAKDNEAYLAAPHAGDIYTVCEKDSAGRMMYSLLKVVRVEGNNLELLPNDYSTNDATPLDDLNEAGRYAKESFTVTQLDLLGMKNRGELTDVDRLEE